MNGEQNNSGYRPWQQAMAGGLTAAFEQRSLHHALLLSGPASIGKRHFATVFARYLLCQQPVAGSADIPAKACGRCQSCMLFDAGTHPDRYWVSCPEEKKNIGVDQIRAVQHKLLQKAQIATCKVCIVGSANDLNANAANAFLKLLEEPPENTYFLLIAHQAQSVLPTIKSRCLQLRFRLPDREILRDFLRQQFASAAAIDVDETINAARGFPERALLELESRQSGETTGNDDLAQVVNDLLFRKTDVQEVMPRLANVELSLFIDELQRQVHSQLLSLHHEPPSEHLAEWLAQRRFYDRLQLCCYQARVTAERNPNRNLFLEQLIGDIATAT